MFVLYIHYLMLWCFIDPSVSLWCCGVPLWSYSFAFFETNYTNISLGSSLPGDKHQSDPEITGWGTWLVDWVHLHNYWPLASSSSSTFHIYIFRG